MNAKRIKQMRKDAQKFIREHPEAKVVKVPIPKKLK